MAIKILREGKAIFKTSIGDENNQINLKTAFYNPKMKLNRDIAVGLLNALCRWNKEQIKVLEPLAATGVRSIRFALEVACVSLVKANDVSKRAYEVLKQNIELNGLKEKILPYNYEANFFMLLLRGKKEYFDYIDIDPFGSPIYYIDSSIKVIKSKGIIAVTATDTAALCGVYPDVCLRRYDAVSTKTSFQHEVGLRILMGSIARHAVKHEVGVEFLLSYAEGNHYRTYFTIHRGKASCRETLEKIGYTIYCKKCFWRKTIKRNLEFNLKHCPRCSEKTVYLGPLWTASLGHEKMCESLMSSAQKEGVPVSKKYFSLLANLKREVEGTPTYYNLHSICSRLKISPAKKSLVIDYLRNKGFKAVETHFDPYSIKTNASIQEVEEAVFNVKT